MLTVGTLQATGRPTANNNGFKVLIFIHKKFQLYNYCRQMTTAVLGLRTW